MNKIIPGALTGLLVCGVVCWTVEFKRDTTPRESISDELPMTTLHDFLSREGDAFDKLSPLASAIQKRIEGQGLNPLSSPEADLDLVSTWQERAVVRLLSFYCVCSNSGSVSPHLDYGLSLIPELEAVGATSTIKALRELESLEERVEFLDESPEVVKIESQVPGDFVWADPILEYVRVNQAQFMKQMEDKS